MHTELLPITNPNYLHGCHPIDLSDYFGDSPFSLIVKQVRAPSQSIDPRLRIYLYKSKVGPIGCDIILQN